MAFKTSFWCLGRDSMTMIQTMQAIHELASPMAQRTFETFDQFEGIDDVIIASLEPACREALGKRFIKVESYGKACDSIFILPDRYNENALALSVDFQVAYRSMFGDIMEDASMHNLTRGHIRQSITKAVCSIDLQHRGHWGNKRLNLILTVVVEPKFSDLKLAASC